MNFSLLGGGLGFLGGWALFGALMIAFTVAVTLIVRAVRGRDDTSDTTPGERAPEDDYIL